MNTNMKQHVGGFFIPEIERLLQRMCTEKEGMRVAGIPSLDGRDVFVSGAGFNLISYIVCRTDWSSAEYRALCSRMQEIARLLAVLDSQTWGCYYFLQGIYRLMKAGRLYDVLDEEALDALREKLTWRNFVREDLSLIKLPTNYYAIAYVIARYRELFGWDKEGFSALFLDKLLDHVDQYTSGMDYMDETNGDGRFDIYSLYMPGEMASMFFGIGEPVPDQVIRMLRKACDVMLLLANEEGYGFSYGRSLGVHGDACPLTVFANAAKLGLLTEDEMQLAHGYSTRLIRRIAHFWADGTEGCINLWWNGRRVDDYRHKDRVLQVTLNIYYRVCETYDRWKDCGLGNADVCSNFSERLARLPTFTFFRFTPKNRGLAIWRDKGQVFSLPLLHGGRPYYCHGQYLPIPYSAHLQCAPDTILPNLVPCLALNTGDQLMPIAHMDQIHVQGAGMEWEVTYEQSCMCRLGERDAGQDARLRSRTTYRFAPGSIQHRDEITNEAQVTVHGAAMEFSTYAKETSVEGETILFTDGPIRSITAHGLELQGLDDVRGQKDYRTPRGSLQRRIHWALPYENNAQLLVLGWIIHY